MMLYTVCVAFCWEVRTKNAGNDNVANKVSGIFFHHNCFQSIPRKWPERLERGAPCWLLKLRWMGTQRGHMIGVLPWLVGWTRRAGTKDFCPALAALVSQIQNIIFHRTLFHFNSPHRPCNLERQACRVACLCVSRSDRASGWRKTVLAAHEPQRKNRKIILKGKVSQAYNFI